MKQRTMEGVLTGYFLVLWLYWRQPGPICPLLISFILIYQDNKVQNIKVKTFFQPNVPCLWSCLSFVANPLFLQGSQSQLLGRFPFFLGTWFRGNISGKWTVGLDDLQGLSNLNASISLFYSSLPECHSFLMSGNGGQCWALLSGDSNRAQGDSTELCQRKVGGYEKALPQKAVGTALMLEHKACLDSTLSNRVWVVLCGATMVLVGPLQLRIFHDSMKQKYPYFVVQSDKEVQILAKWQGGFAVLSENGAKINFSS